MPSSCRPLAVLLRSTWRTCPSQPCRSFSRPSKGCSTPLRPTRASGLQPLQRFLAAGWPPSAPRSALWLGWASRRGRCARRSWRRCYEVCRRRLSRLRLHHSARRWGSGAHRHLRTQQLRHQHCLHSRKSHCHGECWRPCSLAIPQTWVAMPDQQNWQMHRPSEKRSRRAPWLSGAQHQGRRSLRPLWYPRRLQTHAARGSTTPCPGACSECQGLPTPPSMPRRPSRGTAAGRS
mmetsp:Transcript_54834/g.175812  ORF Transcript_54834/g.175812 Transcript_54834/m.175812 type:complete len:234 (-) Transcript_54834:500-1201(-)